MTEALSCPDKTSSFDVSLAGGGAARVGLVDECIACPETQVDGCALCIAGKYCTLDGDAPDCAPGTYADVGDLTECKACDLGRFQNLNGSTACKVCDFAALVDAGEPDSVVSVPTQASFYPFLFADYLGATQCNRVPAGMRCGGQHAVASSSSVSSAFAGGDSSSGARETLCDPRLPPEPCAPGTYREEEMFSPSDPKEAGKCVPCAEGRFVALPGATTCDDCDPGFFQGARGTTQCDACGLNNTLDPGGDYQAEPGQSACVLCELGRFQNTTTATECRPCKRDFSEYADREGLTRCIPCPEGQECLVVTAPPTLCPMGTFSDVTCKPCAPGSYTDDAGQLSCTPCAAGRYTSVLNTDFPCEACPPGSQCADPAVDPEPCGLGTFTAEEELTACEACAPARFQSSTNSTACEDCEQGRCVHYVGPHMRACVRRMRARANRHT